jgi:hypothetical protein
VAYCLDEVGVWKGKGNLETTKRQRKKQLDERWAIDHCIDQNDSHDHIDNMKADTGWVSGETGIDISVSSQQQPPPKRAKHSKAIMKKTCGRGTINPHHIFPERLHRLVHELLERFKTSEYGTPVIQRAHALAETANRPGNVWAMHSNNCGRGWIFTPLNCLNQFQSDRDFEKCWGCAGHRDAGHYFDVERIHVEEILGSIVGLNGGDGVSDEGRGAGSTVSKCRLSS